MEVSYVNKDNGFWNGTMSRDGSVVSGVLRGPGIFRESQSLTKG